MQTKHKVKLGQEVFVLSSTGEVVRTMIGEICAGDEFNHFKPRYTLLNGHSGPHWFKYAEAVSAAKDHMAKRTAALQKRLAVLRKKVKHQSTDEARQAVMVAPYKVINLKAGYSGHEHMSRSATRNLKRICVPDTYLEPGTRVYLIVTPQVKLRDELSKFCYRPFSHFVLETVITKACFSPDGKVHLAFATPFQVNEYFATRKEAKLRLKSYSEPGTVEPVNFVSYKRELQEIAKIPDIPF